jgi:hypothetical protein
MKDNEQQGRDSPVHLGYYENSCAVFEPNPKIAAIG